MPQIFAPPAGGCKTDRRPGRGQTTCGGTKKVPSDIRSERNGYSQECPPSEEGKHPDRRGIECESIRRSKFTCFNPLMPIRLTSTDPQKGMTFPRPDRANREHLSKAANCQPKPTSRTDPDYLARISRSLNIDRSDRPSVSESFQEPFEIAEAIQSSLLLDIEELLSINNRDASPVNPVDHRSRASLSIRYQIDPV